MYRTVGSKDYSSYPIGGIIMSASQDMDSDWLRCDGSYINETDYPELTAYLGKNSPGADDYKKAISENYTGLFSTSCVYNGSVFVYNVEAKKLIKTTIGEDTKVEVNVGGSMNFVDTTVNPIILSVCGGKLFLAQWATENDIRFYAGVLTLSGTIPMSAIDVNTKISELTKGEKATRAEVIIEPCIPQVVKLNDGSFACVLGYDGEYVRSERSGTSGAYNYRFYGQINNYYLKISSDLSGASIESTIYTNNYKYVSTGSSTSEPNNPINDDIIKNIFLHTSGNKIKFSDKSSNEAVAIYVNTVNASDSEHLKIKSDVNGLYDKESTSSYQYAYSSNRGFLSPIISSENFICGVDIKDDNKMYVRCGAANPLSATNWVSEEQNPINGITLSPYATVFDDSVEYIENYDLWIVFVGTGICFTSTPTDFDSWGYLDTTNEFGIIMQYGGCRYDLATNTLCVFGCNTEGKHVVGSLKIKSKFDYSNDGAWLPYIASDGVPAWIKAYGPKTPELKITVETPKDYSSVVFEQWFQVILDGETVVPGTYNRIYNNEDETFTFGIRSIATGGSGSYKGGLLLNGENVLKSAGLSVVEVGQEWTTTIRVGDFLSTGVTLKGQIF